MSMDQSGSDDANSLQSALEEILNPAAPAAAAAAPPPLLRSGMLEGAVEWPGANLESRYVLPYTSVVVYCNEILFRQCSSSNDDWPHGFHDRNRRVHSLADDFEEDFVYNKSQRRGKEEGGYAVPVFCDDFEYQL